jgi:hypothetical protein
MPFPNLQLCIIQYGTKVWIVIQVQQYFGYYWDIKIKKNSSTFSFLLALSELKSGRFPETYIISSVHNQLLNIQCLRLALSKGPNWVGVFSPLYLRTETHPVSETSCFYSLEYWMMEEVQRPSNSVSKHPAYCLLHAHIPHSYSAHNLLRVCSCKNECTDLHGNGVKTNPPSIVKLL